MFSGVELPDLHETPRSLDLEQPHRADGDGSVVMWRDGSLAAKRSVLSRRLSVLFGGTDCSILTDTWQSIPATVRSVLHTQDPQPHNTATLWLGS